MTEIPAPSNRIPDETRQAVLEVAAAGELTRAEIAKRYNVSIATIKIWVRQAGLTTKRVRKGTTPSEQPHSELRELRQRIITLEHENDVLSKTIVDLAIRNAMLLRDLNAAD